MSGARSLPSLIVGSLLLASVGGAAAWDLGLGLANFAELGPLGPRRETPRFELEMLSGDTLRSNEDLLGKPTLLVFWATWCGACKQTLPSIEVLARAHADEVTVIAVNQDQTRQRAAVTNYVDETDLRLAVALDGGEVGRAFRVSLIPHTVLLDRRGRIRHVHQGVVGNARLEAELSGLLSE